MLKRGVFALFVFLAAGAAYAVAPTDQQIKQALYERYASGEAGAADLQKALNNEVTVGACEPQGDQYRCQIENTLLNTSIPMLFARDPAGEKWKFVREDTQ